MAWTASRIFLQAMLNPIAHGVAGTSGFPTSYSTTGLTAASEAKFALYNSATMTPDATVAVGLTGYNASTSAWVTANETTNTSGTAYTAGGSTLTSPTFATDATSVSVCFTASALSWTTASFTAYGGLLYDNVIAAGTTVAKQGMCYNYFGGLQTVTSGTFTVNWATVGSTTAIFNIAV